MPFTASVFPSWPLKTGHVTLVEVGGCRGTLDQEQGPKGPAGSREHF